MIVCFRTDSSTLIGTGHVMRCLALAELLRNMGAYVLFICRNLPGNIINSVTSKEFEVHVLPDINESRNYNTGVNEYEQWLIAEKKNAPDEIESVFQKLPKKIDWFIIDHYALDAYIESMIRPGVNKIMVIDDLANRKHDCDLLLDQNLYDQFQTRYNNLIPKRTCKLLGPKYVLLRSEFSENRKINFVHSGSLKNVLIFFGGVDQTNETEKAIDAVVNLHQNQLEVNAVIGFSNLNFENLKKRYYSMPNVKLYKGINNMAEMIAASDLSIGSGGTITWERLCLGLPSLTIAVVEHQIPAAELLNKLGISRFLGFWSEVTSHDITAAVTTLLSSPYELVKMSLKGMNIVDGKGCERVFKCLNTV